MTSLIKRRMDPSFEDNALKKKVHTQDDDDASIISNSSEASSTNFLKTSYDDINSPTKTTEASMHEESPQPVTHTPKKKSKHATTYEEFARKCLKDPSAYIDTYKVVKFRNVKYRVNDTLLILNEEDANNDFICTLLRIIKPVKYDEKKVLAFLEVQW